MLRLFLRENRSSESYFTVPQKTAKIFNCTRKYTVRPRKAWAQCIGAMGALAVPLWPVHLMSHAAVL